MRFGPVEPAVTSPVRRGAACGCGSAPPAGALRPVAPAWSTGTLSTGGRIRQRWCGTAAPRRNSTPGRQQISSVTQAGVVVALTPSV